MTCVELTNPNQAFVGTWLSNAATNPVFGTDAVKPDITPISLTPDQSIPTTIVNPQGTEPAASHDPPLSPEQERILGRIIAGEDFFFTGSAGTGKSVLLRAIIRSFKERHNAEKVQRQRRVAEVLGDLMRLKEDDWVDEKDVERWKLGVTASTGMAAV
jgi:Cdc6-like AAA superfamily ATPase